MAYHEEWELCPISAPSARHHLPLSLTLPFRDNIHQSPLGPGRYRRERLGGASSSLLPQGGPATASAPLHFSFLSFSSFRIPTPSLIQDLLFYLFIYLFFLIQYLLTLSSQRGLPCLLVSKGKLPSPTRIPIPLFSTFTTI